MFKNYFSFTRVYDIFIRPIRFLYRTLYIKFYEKYFLSIDNFIKVDIFQNIYKKLIFFETFNPFLEKYFHQSECCKLSYFTKN